MQAFIQEYPAREDETEAYSHRRAGCPLFRALPAPLFPDGGAHRPVGVFPSGLRQTGGIGLCARLPGKHMKKAVRRAAPHTKADADTAIESRIRVCYTIKGGQLDMC